MTMRNPARPFPAAESAPLRIAVAGNPNSGKSTLINSLAGTRLHVGNWPGVTVGTYILAVSVLVWFLLNLPWGVEQRKDSYLGTVGQAIAPVFKPLGFGTWEAASSLAWTVALAIYQGGRLFGLGG